MESNEFLTLVERIESIKKLICELDKGEAQPEPYQSEKIDELYSALARAQGKFPPLDTNKVNPWFDTPYADIFHLGKKLYPVLSGEGLSVQQPKRVTTDGGTLLYTRLCHSSGQWCESRVRVIPPKNDIDSYRSTLNALRASELLSILGIGVAHDPFDDDGETAMIETRKAFAKPSKQKDVKTKQQDSEVITKEQREEIEYEMGEYTELAQEILDRCHVRSLSDIPQSQFRNAITFIRKNKNAREGKEG